ncbi:MAG: MBL fold metallo-hydrolase [Burkholderiaceae bacterium]|nr:MBL fold metallo-hydrolase [Burkholderiaceae bacterium]
MTAHDIRLPPSLRFIQRDWLSSNHLLGRGPEGNVLVDTGYSTRRDLTLQLVDHALGGASLDRIVNTHTHSDHVGGNAALAARYRCSITIPAREREVVERWDEEALHYGTMGQHCDRFTADDWFDVGDRLRIGGLEWQALGSPGHDMDSLLLWQPDHRLLVSADALWEDGFGIVFPEFFDEAGFAAQAATLDMLAGLDAAVVIPGHGPMFTDYPAALDRARRRLSYLRANPQRHALSALKVALSFMLLDRQRIGLRDLETVWGRLPLVQRINRKYFDKEVATLTREVLASLLAAKVARIEDGWLLPVGQAG